MATILVFFSKRQVIKHNLPQKYLQIRFLEERLVSGMPKNNILQIAC
jgi:hypothetical protein